MPAPIRDRASITVARNGTLLEPRIAATHFALARGWIQGMDLRALADRYLAAPLSMQERAAVDLREARRTLEHVLDELAAAARREGLVKDAALLKRQAARIRLPAAPLSLEEFAQELGAADFYSEAELLALYEAEHGAAVAGNETMRRAQQRRARLVARQLELVSLLERQHGATMTPASLLSQWLAAPMARRLLEAGIATTAQLVERIRGTTGAWHAGIRGIGATKAARIERFLEASVGPIPRPVDPGHWTPPVDAERRHAIVPLERLVLPEALDGSQGALRAAPERCRIAARNDREAIVAFLATRSGDHTRRAYRKELERYLLWCVVERGRAMSDTTAEDCVVYLRFIADPQPASAWCGPRSRRRCGPSWRPFEQGLSPRSQAYAVTVLRAFFGWANRVCYLAGNPWGALVGRDATCGAERDPSAGTGRLGALGGADLARFRPLERTLTQAQWQSVRARLGGLPDTSRTRRLQFVLALAHATGLRLGELVSARAAHLRWRPHDGKADGGWRLEVMGKGKQRREVNLPDELVHALRRYLAERSLPDDLGRLPPGTFLIGKLASSGGVKAHTLYEEIKRFLGQCATASAASGDTVGAARLERASTHWVRHTHASQAIAAGVALEVVRDTLGHASLATTRQYLASGNWRRKRERPGAMDVGLPAPTAASVAPTARHAPGPATRG